MNRSVSSHAAAMAVCAVAVTASPAPGREAVEALASQILSARGVRPGLVVHVGCRDGSLATELSAGGRNLVHGICLDPKSLAAARESFRARRVYGKVSVDSGSAARLPYAAGATP